MNEKLVRHLRKLGRAAYVAADIIERISVKTLPAENGVQQVEIFISGDQDPSRITQQIQRDFFALRRN